MDRFNVLGVELELELRTHVEATFISVPGVGAPEDRPLPAYNSRNNS